jgi:hypothetical protein
MSLKYNLFCIQGTCVQCDLIVRFFAFWGIVYFWQLFENCRSRQNFWAMHFFHGKIYTLILTTMGWATFWGIFHKHIRSLWLRSSWAWNVFIGSFFSDAADVWKAAKVNQALRSVKKNIDPWTWLGDHEHLSIRRPNVSIDLFNNTKTVLNIYFSPSKSYIIFRLLFYFSWEIS